MLNFKDELAAYAVGRRVNSEEWNSRTGNFEAANDDLRLGYGVPVRVGAQEEGILPMDATNARSFVGITEASAVLPRPGDGYARYDEVSVLEWGVIGVETEGNTVRDGVARWNTATSKWTGAAQSATVVTIPGCTFEKTLTAPGVAPVRLRRPNPALTASG